ncbi:sugar phosphate isomerase/epimerase family protein [Paenibacillus sp. UNC451MF]|uniref:sugar phosphate isomerase/epimerase family protein n=1 Tax=Paenibacillus sp. UNC451MF TaxID=1449063 RepID=UPI000491E7BE|nr:sugar phosphate isomerase/epimerase family protein [Paenibacillus sp. UNC451MF]
MRLSTMTSFFGKRLDGDYTPLIESVRRSKEVGFQVMDVSFCHALFGKTELVKDNWEALISDLRNEAEKLGVEFSQSHPVFLTGHPANHPVEKQELFQEMMRRSIIASSILGVKWAALHPIEEKTEALFDTEASIKANLEYFSPIVELAIKHNVGVAFENMIERAATKRRFASHAGELAALVDAYNDKAVGACWDFGHGNFLYKDQRFALRTLGKRLKSTHVNDNYGQEDEHMFPFHGSVDWASIMPVLTEIGYEGDFSFETHKEFDRLPESIKDIVARSGYEIGKYCLSLA